MNHSYTYKYKKVLHGLLRIALMSYRNLVEVIEAYGLQINLHEKCVVNKMINVKQMTVV